MKIYSVSKKNCNYPKPAFGTRLINNKELQEFRSIYLPAMKDWAAFLSKVEKIGPKNLFVEMGTMYETNSLHSTLTATPMLKDPLVQHVYGKLTATTKTYRYAPPERILEGCQKLAERFQKAIKS